MAAMLRQKTFTEFLPRRLERRDPVASGVIRGIFSRIARANPASPNIPFHRIATSSPGQQLATLDGPVRLSSPNSSEGTSMADWTAILQPHVNSR